MKAIIDGDILAYECAFGSQDRETGEVYNFQTVADRIDQKIADICDAVGADSYQLYLTGTGNFREEIAVTKPYKGNRNQEKPFHLYNARAYLESLGAIVVDGMEADDAMAIAQEESLRKNGVRHYLNDGTYFIVDYENWGYVREHTWFTNKDGYIVREEGSSRKPSSRRTIRLHREILGDLDGFVVDHINGDIRDNRLVNLRHCSVKENVRNSTSSRGTSQFKGVHYCKERAKWAASIKVDGKTISLGRYEDEEDAAKAYDVAALKFFGEFANLNLDDNHEVPDFLETVICTRDKDLRQVPALHYGWEMGKQPEYALYWVDELGEIELTEGNKKKEVKGNGLKFFYSQLITGDPTDNIPGLRLGGAVKAFNALADCKSEEELYLAARELYKERAIKDNPQLGEALDAYVDAQMLEQGRLLWMVRELDEEGNPVMWELPL